MTKRFLFLIFEVNENEIQNEALLFQPIMSPDALSAQRVIEASENFTKVQSNLKRHQIKDERKKLLEKLRWE